MCLVRISGYRVGRPKVAMTKAIRQCTVLSLAEAKKCTDAVLGGQVINVTVPNPEAGRALVAELVMLRAVAELAED